MYQEPDFKVHDYIIGGKMVVGRAMMEHSYAVQMNSDQAFRDEVKKKLIMDMAQFILENNLVEFTQYDEQDWFYVQDPEKKFKLANGETPVATKYFLPRDNEGNVITKSISPRTTNKPEKPQQSFSVEALANKFNRNFVR